MRCPIVVLGLLAASTITSACSNADAKAPKLIEVCGTVTKKEVRHFAGYAGANANANTTLYLIGAGDMEEPVLIHWENAHGNGSYVSTVEYRLNTGEPYMLLLTNTTRATLGAGTMSELVAASPVANCSLNMQTRYHKWREAQPEILKEEIRAWLQNR